MKYFQSTIERLLYILLVILVVVNVAGGLLIYSVLTRQEQVIKSQQETVASLKAIINDHTGTLSTINHGFDSLNDKVNCIFKYFATEGHNSNTTISLTPNQQECNVNINPTTAPVGSSSSTKSD